MKRREFLSCSTAGAMALATGAAHARDPISRSGAPRFQIGLAAYSLRNYFAFMKGKANSRQRADGPAMDMEKFIDYCADHGFDAAELTSYFFPPDLTNEQLLDIKHHAFVRGVTISGTAIGNNFTVGKGPELEKEVVDAVQWIEKADVMGAPHVRFFAGTGRQLSQNPERMEEAVEAVERCAELAGKKGIFLGIENHGQLTSAQMLEIMKRVKSRWVGINLDTGNFVSEDPYGDLEKCVPYAVNVQVKVTMKSPSGMKYEADLDRVGKLLRDGSYQGFVVLEYEESDPYDNIPMAYNKLKAALSE